MKGLLFEDLEAFTAVAKHVGSANDALLPIEAFIDTVVIKSVHGEVLATFGWDENAELVLFQGDK